MRLKSRGVIVSLLSGIFELIAGVVISFVNAFAYSVAKKGIETRIANVKREKVYCRTNSMAAVKWTAKNNLDYKSRENGNLIATESGQIQGFAVFKGG